MKKIVVVGGVAAGMSAASKAARMAKDVSVTVYTQEDYISYSACSLPYMAQGLITDLGDLVARTPEQMKESGVDMTGVYNDCGLLLYGGHSQDVHCGGSGCGCSASVICGHILKRFARGELREVLYLATGALMSPGSLKQGASIPGIAHLVHFSSEKRR